MTANERQTILIVDDEAMDVSILSNALKNKYRVLVAKSGEQALRIIDQDDVDLVLLDIVMPELDGYEVLRRLKTVEADSRTSVIFITSKTEDQDEAKGLQLGAADYIRKPFFLPIVEARVQTHLELKRIQVVMENANEDLQKEVLARKRALEERERLIQELQDALKQIRTLSGLLPICSSCKRIRDDEGYWNQIEVYVRDHSEAEFSHGICPGCAKKLYPEIRG